MPAPRHALIVSLWTHPGQESAFEAFERDAARVMAKHGGRIDHAVRVTQDGSGDAPFEIHCVSFPDRTAAEAYASDPEMPAMQQRRAAIIARTERLVGRMAGPY